MPRLSVRADAADFGRGHAALVLLLIDVAVAADFDLAPFGEEVDDRDADAVQAAGGLIGALVELAAELEHGHHALSVENRARSRRAACFDRDAAAVVFDRDRAVDVDRDADVRGVAGHRLVDRVVDDFVDQVVQAAQGRIADVHARPFADVLQVAQVLRVCSAPYSPSTLRYSGMSPCCWPEFGGLGDSGLGAAGFGWSVISNSFLVR